MATNYGELIETPTIDPAMEHASLKAAGTRWPTFRHCPECGGRLYLSRVDEVHPDEVIQQGSRTGRYLDCWTVDAGGSRCDHAEAASMVQVDRLMDLAICLDFNKSMLQAIQLMELGTDEDLAIGMIQAGFDKEQAIICVVESERAADEADTIASIMNAGAK